MNEAKFWLSPNSMWKSGIADGACYLFEGAEEGKYHVVIANSPPDADHRFRLLETLCKEMIKLSGLDLMKL